MFDEIFILLFFDTLCHIHEYHILEIHRRIHFKFHKKHLLHIMLLVFMYWQLTLGSNQEGHMFRLALQRR